MTSPCPRCGATRTDSVPHGPMYKLAWAVGYRLCRCSRCRLPRFVRKHQDESPNSSQLREEAAAGRHSAEETREIAKETFAPKITKRVASADSSNRGSGCCPVCGGTQCHRLSAPPWNESYCAHGWPAARIAGRAFPIPCLWRNPLTRSIGGGSGSRTPLCGGVNGNCRRDLRAKSYRGSTRGRFLEPWMGPLPGLRQHGIPPFSAHHLGTNPAAAKDGPLQEVPEAFSLSQVIEVSDSPSW